MRRGKLYFLRVCFALRLIYWTSLCFFSQYIIHTYPRYIMERCGAHVGLEFANLILSPFYAHAELLQLSVLQTPLKFEILNFITLKLHSRRPLSLFNALSPFHTISNSLVYFYVINCTEQLILRHTWQVQWLSNLSVVCVTLLTLFAVMVSQVLYRLP